MSARGRSAGASPRCAPAGAQRGFSLLEVLVAIVLLGFSYAGILGALSQGLKLARQAADQENAAILAHSLLEETRALPKANIADSDDRGEVFGGTRYAYKIEVFDVPYLGEPPPEKVQPPLELKRIVVDVHWGEGERQRHYQLDTFQTVAITPGTPGQAAPAASQGEAGKAAPPATTTPGTPDAAKKP